MTHAGFALGIPAGAPWPRTGRASLCFAGRATFVGRLDGSDFTVERMLPELPLVADTNEIFDPTPAVCEAPTNRLTAELARRGQAVPTMPAEPPWESRAALR